MARRRVVQLRSGLARLGIGFPSAHGPAPEPAPPAAPEPPPEPHVPDEPAQEPPAPPSPWTLHGDAAAAAPDSIEVDDASQGPSRWLPSELIREDQEPRGQPPSSDPSRWLSRPPEPDESG